MPLSLRPSEATVTPASLGQIEHARWTKRLSGNAPLSDSFHDAQGRKTLEDFDRVLGPWSLSIFRGWRKSQPKKILKAVGRPH